MSDKRRRTRSIAWKYFTDIGNSYALCKLCSTKFSFKTSVSNLVKHVVRSHPQINIREENPNQSEGRNKSSATASSDEEEGSRSSGNSEEQLIWSYFERETGGRARCVVCRGTLSQHADSLRQHLQTNHPKLASGLVLGSDGDANSDADRAENEDLITEYVYLDDGSNMSAQKKVPSNDPAYKRKRQSNAKKHKLRRHSSSSEEDRRVFYLKSGTKTKEQPDDAIDTFGTYILSVMKTLPKHIQAKLQLDIVNSVVSAKLEYETEQQNKSVNHNAIPVIDNDTKPQLYVKSSKTSLESNDSGALVDDVETAVEDKAEETVASTFTSNGYAFSVAAS